ncbi:nucleotide sugar dehydrogenase [Radiobacillus kanasensis]|uniref:nucleotide sugar dehydrogenase n=1 Tax=Radiobacillus kanasensis TaxID=2844358 RepID=UPI001E51B2E5|nr:nucleotide sugar dehydrogenase [Radiobacillus kanasensis]UFU00045.1 nucleotide sugar dehydrogenase [Radiobacillus kanasensis]
MIEKSQSLPQVAVVGLGKIGLTLAAVFANNGYKVFGADKNKQVVDRVNQGKSHITNEPGLNQFVQDAHQNNTLIATDSNVEAVSKANIVVVIVPVLVNEDNEIDYQYIDAAVQDIGAGLQEGTLVIFETTLPPGDTQNRFGKKIEEVSGLTMGEQFYLAYSPERVYSNRIIKDLQHYPKVVGGINKKSVGLASDFYKQALNCKLIQVSSLETAEFSKVAECVYRDVNIALANELAKFAEEKNIRMSEVITASNSQPFSHLHSPGIGVGGHCIPIYPYFFVNKGLDQGLTPLSREINDSMASYAISKIEKRIGSLENKKVLILGLSYREDVKEPTKSTTLLLLEQLRHKQANIFVNDPHFTEGEIINHGGLPLSLDDKLIEEVDVLILQAFHEEYKEINFKDFTKCKLILDGRNKLNEEEISRLGIIYESIGN